MKKTKYMVVVNLVGVSDIIKLRPIDGGWWDEEGNFGWFGRKGPLVDSRCHEFVTEKKEIAEAFKLGTEVLAKHLKTYLGSRN